MSVQTASKTTVLKARIETAVAMDAANMTAQGLQRAIDAALAEC
ncbi:MAG: hypothetical protein AAF730_16740 [Bacteroidota bacterium]